MNDGKISREIDWHLVTKIVISYIKYNTIAASDLPGIISSVHQSLSNLGKSSLPVETLKPPVPVRRSVQPEYVVCLECGFRAKTLRRHLRDRHRLDRAAYYARWNLPSDHPITAPAYSATRSATAKKLGLGRGLGRGRARRAAGSARLSV